MPSILLYNLLLHIGVLVLFPVWLAWMIWVPKTRAGFLQKLGYYPKALDQSFTQPSDKPRVWFHAVSVGELNAIRPLVTALANDIEPVISTTTKTGQELAHRLFSNLTVFYFPYDLPGPIIRAITACSPDLVVIAETELWPNFIYILTQRFKCSLILMNGRLSERSYKGYLRAQWLLAPCLQLFTHLYMQSETDAKRISTVGKLSAEYVSVTGNIKFDINSRVNLEQQAQLKQLLNITSEDSWLVFASTHSGEDDPFINLFCKLKQQFPHLKMVLAPRHPERLAEIEGILQQKKLAYSVRSKLTSQTPNTTSIVILNSIGELTTIYSFAKLAVMGGSFIPHGGQNPLEPISQKLPVIYGPHMFNFAEINRLVLEAEAGTQVDNYEQLEQEITTYLTQPDKSQQCIKNGQLLLQTHSGVTQILASAIRETLGK